MHDGEPRVPFIRRHTHIVWAHTFLGSVWLSLRNINIVSAVAQHLSELLFARCVWHCVPPRLWLSVFISVSDVQMHTHNTASMGKTRFTWEKPYHFIVKSNALVMRLMLSSPKQTWASHLSGFYMIANNSMRKETAIIDMVLWNNPR